MKDDGGNPARSATSRSTHTLNMHTHGDHTGSNLLFPASVEVVTHADTAAKMPEFQAQGQVRNL